MIPRRIYLDNNASTPLHPRVIEAMLEEFQHSTGNPSSVHHFGQQARNRLTKARDTIAQFLGVRSEEIIFHSCSTEGNNMVIRGLFEENPSGHIITSNTEHSSIATTIQKMESLGVEVTFLPSGKWGVVRPEQVAEAIRPNTRLIALAGANNETGVLLETEAIAALAYQHRIPFLVDAVAWIGKEPLQVFDGVSAMTFSGHKFHSPKGVGFSFIRRNLKLTAMMTGGEHEYGRRAGTQNLVGIIGMAEAIRLLQEELPQASAKMRQLRDRLEQGILETVSEVFVNGEGPRVCNTTNLAFGGIEGESLLASLDLEGIAVSHGSACSAGALEPSRVLLNMGVSKKLAKASLRFSLSSLNTEEEIERTIQIVKRVVDRLRDLTKIEV